MVTKLGFALQAARDRVFGSHRVCLVADKGRKGKRYALVKASPPPRQGLTGDLGSKGPPSETGGNSTGCGHPGSDGNQRPPQGPPRNSLNISNSYATVGDVGGPLPGSGAGENLPSKTVGTENTAKVPKVPHPRKTPTVSGEPTGGPRSPERPRRGGGRKSQTPGGGRNRK